MDAVLSSDEKASRSAVVIDNSGTVGYTLSLLPPLLAQERQTAGETASAAAPGGRRRRSERYAQPAESDAPPPPSSFQGADAAGIRETAQSRKNRIEPVSRPESAASDPDSEGVSRPRSSRRRPSERKAGWRMPVWLVVSLSICAACLLVGVTAQALMQAYLTRQENAHMSDARAVLREYPLEYRDLIDSTAVEYNLQPAFVSAIIRNESSFQPRAESGVGARGLMQLMPDTAEWIAGKMKISGYAFDRMYDPQCNIRSKA